MSTPKVPFFDYPALFHSHEQDYLRIFRDVCERGAYILQKDLSDFERNLAEYAGTKFCVGLNNATDALMLGFIAAGLKSGDEVLFCSHTFVATAGAVHMAGGVPVPVEAGADHLMDPKSLERAITSKTKFILPTHLNGRACQMDQITAVAKKYNLQILEDAAQGLGSKFRGKMAGTFGEASCISFYPAKNLGALGDAGALLTNREDIFEQALLLRDHGRNHKTGEIERFGYNMRMDNLQAAFLNFLLQKYDSTVERRREIGSLYNNYLSSVSELVLPPPPSKGDHFDVFQNYEIEATRRDELKKFLAEKGVGTIVQWGGKAVHQFAGLKMEVNLPFTENLFKRMLMLPMNLFISDEDVNYVCEQIKNFYQLS